MAKKLNAEDTAVNQAVDNAMGTLSNLREVLVRSYWELGQIAADLNKSYGDGVIDKFVKKLSERTDTGNISSSTVYKSMQFFKKHSRADLDRFLSAGISWTQITKTLSKPIESVQLVLRQVEEDDVASTEFASTIERMNRVNMDNPIVEDPNDLGQTMSSKTSVDDGGLDEKAPKGPVDPKDTSPHMGAAGADDSYSGTGRTDGSVRSRLNSIDTRLGGVIDIFADIQLVCADMSELEDEEILTLSSVIEAIQAKMNEVASAGGPAKQAIDGFSFVD